MQRLITFTALALVSCVQPPRATPVESAAASPSPPAPRYPSWDEVSAPRDKPAALDPTPIDSGEGRRALIGGASVHETTVQHNGQSVDLQLILFDDRSYDLRIIDQPEDWSGGGQITDSMRGVNAVAGVNGGFFTPDFKPMGLMIANGHPTGTWQSNKLLTGTILVENEPRLLWNSEVRTRKARELLQAGPRLVDSGHPVASLERSKHVVRTFIATDGGHRWVFGLARNTSLGELAKILSTREIVPDFRIQRALNLDGGRSSALYYRTADGREHAAPGWSTVRNYLAITPR